MVWIFQNFLLGCYQKMKNKRQAKPLGYHAIANELNLLGNLYPTENEKSVYIALYPNKAAEISLCRLVS